MKKQFINCFLFIYILFTGSIFSAVDFPETPAGKRAREVFDLLNNESSYDTEDYIKKNYTLNFLNNFPLATHKSIYEVTRTMFGKLNLVYISKSTPEEFNATLRSESRDAWLNLLVQVESGKPYRISILGLRPGAPPDNYKPSQKKTKKNEKKESSGFSNIEEYNQYLTKKTESNEFSGIVMVARDDKPLFRKAYGYASKRFRVLNNLDTKFNLGSCNKSFTRVAAAQLMEKGKISIDDPIGKYLDMFPKEIADKVTIRHLLNMRSGWGDYWGNPKYRSHSNQLKKVSEYIDFIKDMPLDFKPGSNMQHSNTGYLVLGAIIEAVSGMDYYDYIRKYIYEPAGMTNSDSYLKDEPVKNLATGYTNMNRNDPLGKGYRWNNINSLPLRGTPAGGGYSTAGDILKYFQALRSHTLLNAKYTNYLFNGFKGRPGDSVSSKIFGGIGAAPGMNAYMMFFIKSGYSVIILSNYDMPGAIKVGEEIIKIYGLKNK
jgi:CubicO group peptidase (beta-lactamase class C family)